MINKTNDKQWLSDKRCIDAAGEPRGYSGADDGGDADEDLNAEREGPGRAIFRNCVDSDMVPVDGAHPLTYS